MQIRIWADVTDWSRGMYSERERNADERLDLRVKA